MSEDKHIEEVTRIVSAYVGRSSIPVQEIPELMKTVSRAIDTLDEVAIELKPAVPINKSITPDYIFCLEDGKKFKSLKRHLRSHFNLSPEEYREKWGLPHDYPMVAPNYAAERSQLAKKMGLGRRSEMVPAE